MKRKKKEKKRKDKKKKLTIYKKNKDQNKTVTSILVLLRFENVITNFTKFIIYIKAVSSNHLF